MVTNVPAYFPPAVSPSNYHLLQPPPQPSLQQPPVMYNGPMALPIPSYVLPPCPTPSGFPFPGSSGYCIPSRGLPNYPPRPLYPSLHPLGQRRGYGGGRGVNRGPAQYECKVCNKEYRTEENYRLHMQEHQKCKKCDFMALPRVLKEHELVHLLPDMLKFSSPEEIQKWREERRKNFPTAENIACKKKLAEDRKARGEVALTPLHRYIKHLVGEDRNERRGGRGRGHRRGYGGFRGRVRRGNWHHTTRTRDISSKEEGEEEVVRDLGPSVDNLDGSTETCGHKSVSSEEIMEAILADTTGHKETYSSTAITENKTSLVKEDGGRKRKQKQSGGREAKKRKFDSSTALNNLPPRKPTLLEKLLAPEIRREQNIILQCIRYVVDTGFLGHGGHVDSMQRQLK